MSKAANITLEDAEKIDAMVDETIAFVDEFNRKHPDPEASFVSEYFDYITPSYIRQVCVSTVFNIVDNSSQQKHTGLGLTIAKFLEESLFTGKVKAK